MKPEYKQAIDGTLKSKSGGDEIAKFDVRNLCGIPIRLSWLDSQGDHVDYGEVAPGQASTILKSYPDYYYLVQNALSGGFMFVFKPPPKGQTQLALTPRLFTDPGDIGSYPISTPTIPIPQNSPLIVVACAPATNGNYISREQYWCRQPDSFTLAKGERRTVSVTVTRGLQQTSSASETIAAAVGSSVNAGWGPVSASISASLNISASFFQQVTLTEQTSIYESRELVYPRAEGADGDDGDPVTYFVWQLMDVITVFNKANSQPIASVSSAEAPALIDGPYYLSRTMLQAGLTVSSEPAEELPPPRVELATAPSRGNIAADVKSVAEAKKKKK